MNKSFLKWAGNKFKLMTTINENIDTSYSFVDVFSGSGSVWLNSNSNSIVVNDINKDLINCFLEIK